MFSFVESINIGLYTAQGGAAFVPELAGQIWDVIVLIVAFAFVLFLAYFTIRLMGRARLSRGSRNIKVIEAASVGFQNTVQLVCAGDKCFLIGVSRNGVTLIGEVDKESILQDIKTMPDMPFEKYLSKLFNKENKNGQDGNESDE